MFYLLQCIITVVIPVNHASVRLHTMILYRPRQSISPLHRVLECQVDHTPCCCRRH